MSKKRTLDSFFGSTAKRSRKDGIEDSDGISVRNLTRTPQYDAEHDQVEESTHANYPFPVSYLPLSMAKEIVSLPAREGKAINDQLHLDLLYFEPFIPSYMAKDLFEFLRSELPFYRVEYKIKRGGFETQIRTPR
jgi:hypothetical protein